MCMFVCMVMGVFVVMIMAIIMRLSMIMMMIRIRSVGMFIFSYYRDICPRNAVALVTLNLQPPSSDVELFKTSDKGIRIHPQVNQCSKVHITTDPGKTVVVK